MDLETRQFNEWKQAIEDWQKAVNALLDKQIEQNIRIAETLDAIIKIIK